MTVDKLASWLTRVPHVASLALTTMTLILTNESSSVFQDGKLKSGIYKIWNIYTETYLDIEVHSRNVCCRPAQNLEGNGLVRLFH